MKNYFKKTTTNTQLHQKIRDTLVIFITKHLGMQLPHLCNIQKDTTITDATLISYASGKVNTIQETKVFLKTKHNSRGMPTDNTSTFALRLGNHPILIKTMRYNPSFRTVLPKKRKKR